MQTRVLLISGITALTALIFLVAARPGPPGVDIAIHDWLLGHRHIGLTNVAQIATTSGSSPVLYCVGAAGAGAMWWRRRRTGVARWRRPVIALGVFVTGELLRTGLSDVLHRARPPRADWISPATGWSMPSGHSANAALGALLALWAIWPYLPSPASRRWSAAAAASFAGAVGWSRLYLGVHWPTDVLAGWLFAACWAGLAVVIIQRPPRTGPNS